MKETVFIDGHTIGYQFNGKSNGERTIHARIFQKNTDEPYCRYMKMKLLVRPIYNSKYLFEAVKQI